MNRLRDYTRLIRMYGGALQTEELALDLAELKAYRDKLLEFVPSINMTTRGSPRFSSAQLALLNPELLKNTSPAFTVADGRELEPPYDAAARTSLPPRVQIVLNHWNDASYGFSASTDLIPVQDWILTKLVEVLEKIDVLSKAPSTRKLPPPGTRVGPPRSSPISQFEDDLIKWLKNDPPSSTIPKKGDFDTEWHTIDVQLLEAENALTNNTKVRTLIAEILTRFQASPSGHEEFGMQIGLLHGYA